MDDAMLQTLKDNGLVCAMRCVDGVMQYSVTDPNDTAFYGVGSTAETALASYLRKVA